MNNKAKIKHTMSDIARLASVANESIDNAPDDADLATMIESIQYCLELAKRVIETGDVELFRAQHEEEAAQEFALIPGGLS